MRLLGDGYSHTLAVEHTGVALANPESLVETGLMLGSGAGAVAPWRGRLGDQPVRLEQERIDFGQVVLAVDGCSVG